MFEMPQPARPVNEPREVRVKRLAMRSMRRGIKEMDLILAAFATERLQDMSEDAIEAYDMLLSENDQDLYQLVPGQVPAPTRFAGLITMKERRVLIYCSPIRDIEYGHVGTDVLIVKEDNIQRIINTDRLLGR